MLTTYTLNGIDLDSNTFGWHLSGVSKPRPGISRRAIQLVAGNRDGNMPVPMSEDSPLITLTVRVPEASNEPFLALLDSATLLLGHGTYSATVELLSATGNFGMDFTDYDVLLRFPGLFWRDAATTTSAAIPVAAGPLTFMSGLSAPVRDAIFRISGTMGGFVTVTDSRGTSFTYTGAIAAGSWLRFESATGRAFMVTSDTWVGGTEVTSSITNGPSAYFFSLTPSFTDPATRSAQVSMSWGSMTVQATIEVRGKLAYRI